MKHIHWLFLASIIAVQGTAWRPSTAWAIPQSPSLAEEKGPELMPADSPPSADGNSKDLSTDKESAETSDDSQPPENAPAPPKAKLKLTPSQAAMRDQVRQTLQNFQKQPFDTRQNTAGDIMDFCLPYGCATEITLYDTTGQRRANGITCLCWNFPSGGFEPLALSGGHISARLGYGMQSQPSQFLATLAFARVQANYPLRVENAVRTVADLVESEKLTCRSGSDMSLKLIGLAFYVDNTSWKNDRGEDWSIEKIVREELNRPVLSAGDAGLNRLMGLAYANYRRTKKNLPLEGQFARSEKYLREFYKFAFNLQNTNNGWSYFLSARGPNRDPIAEFRSTAYVLEWLTLSLPEDQLNDSRLVSAMSYVVQGLNTQRNRANMAALPSREINSIARALHALSIYDERFYQNAEEEKPAAEKPTTEKTASKRN